MKTLVIAEKPSVLKEIVSMLEASFGEKFSSRGDYSESSNYFISSFFGHLLEMEKPQAYGEKYKTWSFDTLPILPVDFIFKYSGDKSKRGKLLADLAKKSSLIINATDPDREGEGIFRTWYKYESLKTPVQRFWFNSLTLTDLTKAWKKLKNSSEYDLFYNSQKGRSEADWLVGMNASRAYSIITGERCPVGRVKTAVLAMIVKRDYEVENYKESFNYSLTGRWANYNFTFIENKEYKFESRDFVQNILNKIKNDIFSLSSFNKEEKKQNPPKVFSLPDLQKVANQSFGYSLEKTLEFTQSLYEKKLVTYPRTDSPYIPESDLNDYYRLINNVATPEQKKLLLPGSKPPTVKNTEAPHTGIIITGNTPQGLSQEEQNIYDLICQRFITAFMVPKIYNEYTLLISNGSEVFRSILISVIDSGFESLSKESTEQAENIEEVKNIDENSIKNYKFQISDLQINQIKKTKPKYYTESTLLDAMTNVGRTVTDKDYREILNETEGLGTAATRQMYSKELLQDQFIYEKGKSLISTDKGRNLIQIICPELKSVEKTAELEKKLKLIETGNFDIISFRKEIDSYVNAFISFALNNQNEAKALYKLEVPCPKCHKVLNRFLRCEDSNCGFFMPHSIASKEIEKTQIHKLFSDGVTDTIKGFVNKKGSSFTAKLRFDDDFKIIFDFEKDELGTCKCGGKITESPKAFNCASCKKTIWKTCFSKKLTLNQAIKLASGEAVLIKGLKNAKGETFEAKIIVNDLSRFEIVK